MFGFFLCRRVDFCGELDLEISQSIGLAGGNLGTTSLSTAPLAYDFFRFVSGPHVERGRPVDALVLFPLPRVGAGQAAQHHQPRHEAQIGIRFAGRNMVHLASLSVWWMPAITGSAPRRALRGFGGIRTRADPRAEQSAGAASSGSDGAARHEGQRAMPRARRNQGDDLPLRSARWFLEKPRATGPGPLGGPKSGP